MPLTETAALQQLSVCLFSFYPQSLSPIILTKVCFNQWVRLVKKKKNNNKLQASGDRIFLFPFIMAPGKPTCPIKLKCEMCHHLTFLPSFQCPIQLAATTLDMPIYKAHSISGKLDAISMIFFKSLSHLIP